MYRMCIDYARAGRGPSPVRLLDEQVMGKDALRNGGVFVCVGGKTGSRKNTGKRRIISR